ncbi:MAG TPA: hypothetical protein PKM73_10105 [Verrucomicrobiota bacterium]|nr:hypothetical protein [Verrucomicrobiota bacterium]HNU50122.1 hypothetical protein [Verrucomicrobiota bacterium]
MKTENLPGPDPDELARLAATIFQDLPPERQQHAHREAVHHAYMLWCEARRFVAEMTPAKPETLAQFIGRHCPGKKVEDREAAFRAALLWHYSKYYPGKEAKSKVHEAIADLERDSTQRGGLSTTWLRKLPSIITAWRKQDPSTKRREAGARGAAKPRGKKVTLEKNKKTP